MAAVVADTHALVWYLFEPPELSPAAAAAMNAAADAGDIIHVSAITLVELIYLIERGRIAEAVLDRIRTELTNDDSVITLVPIDEQVANAVERVVRAQVPDMPDRIIAATALALDLPLITRDHRIRAASIHTIW